MPQCKYHEICGRDVEDHSAEGLCILHSTDPAKDTHAFPEALATHRERNGDYFIYFVFPERADFGAATFSKAAFFGAAKFLMEADFSGATFSERADFDRVTFSKGASFSFAKFTKGAFFGGAMFTEEAFFGFATFTKEAFFRAATFTKEVRFVRTSFSEGAEFGGATFTKGADFDRATFTKGADFDRAIFSGRTLFAGRQGRAKAAGHIFADTAVNFRQVIINPPDAVTFLVADLTKCQFQDTDLRKMQFVGLKWPQKGRRTVVYDEIIPVGAADRTVVYHEITGLELAEGSTRLWSQIERLYRELKQNYEDRRDYERAGDFHYGEKEMRRQNPETPSGLRFFLTLYWLFSGYGERYRRRLIWAGLLFVLSHVVGSAP
jgi:uncharacterized protein YjbI with pentapeptide repeats